MRSLFLSLALGFATLGTVATPTTVQAAPARGHRTAVARHARGRTSWRRGNYNRGRRGNYYRGRRGYHRNFRQFRGRGYPWFYRW